MVPLATSSSKKKGLDPDIEPCANCFAVKGCAGVAMFSSCARCGLVAN
jgi:hypothetical protein